MSDHNNPPGVDEEKSTTQEAIKDGAPVVKTTVNLPPDALAALREIANSRSTSVSDVIRRAIWMEKYLHDAIKSGGKILIQDPNDKHLKELLLR